MCQQLLFKILAVLSTLSKPGEPWQAPRSKAAKLSHQQLRHWHGGGRFTTRKNLDQSPKGFAPRTANW